MTVEPMDARPPEPIRGANAWVGQWIWSDTPALAGPTPALPYGSLDPARFDQRVLFRRAFDLTALPTHALVRITADARYALHVNGVEIGTGPVRHGPRRLTYDAYEVGEALRVGRNVIAVLARFYGHPVPWWEPSPPSYTMGGGSLVAELRLDDRTIGTDHTWRCTAGTAWRQGAPPGLLLTQLPEFLDARMLDPAWTQPGYDDSGWAGAHVLAEHSIVGPRGATRPPVEPWGALAARPIPPLGGETRTATVIDRVAGADRPDLAAARSILEAQLTDYQDRREPAAGPRRILHVADFGMIVSGRLDIRVRAPAGASVIGALLEVPTVAALASSATFHYLARGDDDRYRSADPVGGRYLVVATDESAGVRIEDVRLHELLRPRLAVEPFTCDDERLNQIYRVGLRTVDLTAHDAYVDCPTREQRAWTGDAVVHQSVDLVTNQDWSLARWNPRLLAQPRIDGLLPMVVAGDFATPQVPTIPDWSLHWVRSVHNLYRYTGDRALVAGLLGTVEGVLRWFEPCLGDSGLAEDVPGWVLIDWSPVQVRGTSAALNALLARALLDFAEMAEWLGDGGRAGWARDVHRRLRGGFDAFWDEGRRAYRDNIVDGRLGTSVSEHVAAAAVCGDLVPAERTADVLRLLLDRDAMFTASPLHDHGGDALGPADGQPVSVRQEPDWDTERLVVGAQPFFRYVVHDALAILGAADEIAMLCLDWTKLLDDAPTAFRECWEGGSYCHGWSATPTRDLVVHTLGVSPAQPGYGVARVAPRLGPLRSARGAVPTPYGVLTVAVEGLRVRVDSPVPVLIVSRAGTATHHPAGIVEAEL